MTTSAELAVRDGATPELRLPALPSLPDTDSWIRAMASIAKLADQICDTDFIPAAMRGNPAAVTAAFLTGRELGLPPMLALRTINMIKGTPSLSAEYMRSKVLSLGHEFRIAEWDDQHCVIHARRRGDRQVPQVFSYGMADARRAGLVRKNRDGSPGKYETDPMAMMLARATTRTCKALFGDVVMGLATTELLESGDADAVADAIGAAVEMPQPERQRVTGADARARASRNADRETGEVIPDGDAGPTTSGASSSARAPGRSSQTGTAAPSQSSGNGSGSIPENDPRDAVLDRFGKLGVAGAEIGSYLTRLSGHPYASVESLSRAAAEWFADRLCKIATRDELEAAAVAAEARREQDAAAEGAPAGGEARDA